MRILGKGDDFYIVQISNKELANTINCYSHYSLEKKPEVGDEIDMSELYTDNSSLNKINKKISDFKEFFIDCADIMNKFNINFRSKKNEKEN